jgi:GT2 family glycosyltransferase
MDKLAIVILNFNGFEMTKKCINSILSVDNKDIKSEIIIIDNASTDNSLKKLYSEYGQYDNIKILANNKNLGFAKACNQGIKYAINNGAEYILLVNNDVEVKPHFLNGVIDKFKSDKRIGLIAGKLHQGKSGKDIEIGSSKIINWLGKTRKRDLNRGNTEEVIASTTGAMMLIPSYVINKVGFLDERYFFGFEDLEYCNRLNKIGYKILYVPTFEAIHIGGGTNKGKFIPKFIYNYLLSNFIYLKTNNPWYVSYISKLIIYLWAHLRWKKYLLRFHNIEKEEMKQQLSKYNYIINKAFIDSYKINETNEELLNKFQDKFDERFGLK